MSIFGKRLKYVTCKVWNATQPGFVFPEQGDPEFQAIELMARPNLGLAFSGGGTRSSSATLGQLRGLHHLGLLDRARYISAVSGSSLTSTAFTYLPDAWADESFLGPVVPPEEVTAGHLSETDPRSFTHVIANAVVVDDYLRNALRLAGDETFARTVGDAFLRPFNLNGLQRFFTLDENSLAAILQHNEEMRADDFYQVRTGRPYLIVNSLILRPDNLPPQPWMIYFESTPLYVGVRPLFKGAGSAGRAIGGGYIEPFGFDSDAPDRPPDAADRVRVRLGMTRHRYTLSDMIGSSSAAPADTAAKAGLSIFGFPEFKYWPVVRVGRVAAKEYEIGDGGDLENLGIMPLLARRVENIIAFVNTKDPLTGGGPDQINTSLPPIFGQKPGFDTNHVFPALQYDDLVNGLLAAKDKGGTVLFKDRYQVLDNAHYGIEGGWEVQVLWVYNEQVPAWQNALPTSIGEQIGKESLHNFPHYETLFQNPPALIDLTVKQTFLLANLSCWNVVSNSELFKSMATP